MQTPACTESFHEAIQSDVCQPIDDLGNSHKPSQSPTVKSPRRPPSLLFRYPMLWFAGAWSFGTFLANQNSFLSATSVIPLIGSVCTFLMLGLLCRRFAWLSGVCILLSVIMIALLLALVRTPADHDSLSEFATRQSQTVALRGIIRGAATWSPSQFETDSDSESDENLRWLTQWVVDWTCIRNGTQWEAIQSRSKLTIPGRITDHFPGDSIEVFGKLRGIQPATNPGMIDFAKRSKAERLYTGVMASSISRLEENRVAWGYWPSRVRGWTIQKVDQTLQEMISFQQAPLAAALVFGQKEQVDWETQQQLMATGTIHLLAISGLHVEIIAGTLLVICVVLCVRPRWMLNWILGVSLLYVFLAGGRPPVLRAVILVAGTSTARYWGFRSTLFNLLGLAAFILLLMDPYNLYRPGVHLSFVAVGAIGIFHRSTMESYSRRIAIQSLLEESLSSQRRWLLRFGRQVMSAGRMSLWIWLMTSPLIWLHFNLVSPIAIPLNVLLGLPLSIGLFAGLLTAVVGWVQPLGLIFGSLAGSSLGLICWLVDKANSVPWGHFWMPDPPAWWLFAFYGIAFFWLVLWKDRFRGGLAGILLGWIALGISLNVPGPRGLAGTPHLLAPDVTGRLDCTFLDVGHGTCVVLELPDGRVWMYDAGRLGDNQRSFRYIAPSLWAIPTSRIDTLIVSHADADHYNAIPQLLERFKIGRLASTESFWSSPAPGARALKDLLDRKGIARLTWNSETNFSEEANVKLQVIHPQADFRGETDNANSLCLQLEYSGTRVLLSGDIEGSGLTALCELSPRECQILMAPHHGSLSLDASQLLNWCQPKVIVVSGGQRAIRPAVVEKYSSCQTLGITFRDGAIRVSIREDGSYSTYRWSGPGWAQLSPNSSPETE